MSGKALFGRVWLDGPQRRQRRTRKSSWTEDAALLKGHDAESSKTRMTGNPKLTEGIKSEAATMLTIPTPRLQLLHTPLRCPDGGRGSGPPERHTSAGRMEAWSCCSRLCLGLLRMHFFGSVILGGMDRGLCGAVLLPAWCKPFNPTGAPLKTLPFNIIRQR